MAGKKIKLVCLPYAGGSASAFAPLKKHLTDEIDFQTIEYPGRGCRHQETFYRSIADAAADIAGKISLFGGSYAILGHSLGGLIGYETCRLLQTGGAKMPEHLFVSGKQAPHIMIKEKQVHEMPDEDFKREVMELGGTPEEVFQHPELSGYYLPILRADFRISELYRHRESAQLKGLPLTVLGGDRDVITPLQLAEWKRHTTGDFRVMMFSGGHFFINHNFKAVAAVINQALAEK